MEGVEERKEKLNQAGKMNSSSLHSQMIFNKCETLTAATS